MKRGFKPRSSQIITFLAAFICQVNSYTNTETKNGLLSVGSSTCLIWQSLAPDAKYEMIHTLNQ